MSHIALDSTAVRNWHRLDVCSLGSACARTEVSVIGALDSDAVEEIDRGGHDRAAAPLLGGPGPRPGQLGHAARDA